MKIKELKVAMPLMKSCIFESKIVEEYGDIHFLKDSICVINDECVVNYICKTGVNEEFSINFGNFEKVFGKLQNDAEFLIEDKKLIITSGNARIRLAIKQDKINAIRKRLKEGDYELKDTMKGHQEFFYALELCESALVPFGTLAEPFASYICYDEKSFIGCSTFKGARKALVMKKAVPFIVSGDSVNTLINTYKTFGQDVLIKYEINTDQLLFKFGDSVSVSIHNGYGAIEYPIQEIATLFNRDGEYIKFPPKEKALSIIGRIALFPQEFEDTTERVCLHFDDKGIKFKSKNSIGSIVERFKSEQKLTTIAFSLQHKDLVIALNKMPFEDTGKVPVRFFQEGKTSSFILGTDNCKYILSTTMIEDKDEK